MLRLETTNAKEISIKFLFSIKVMFGCRINPNVLLEAVTLLN